MLKTLILAAFAFAALNCASALACDDQTGSVIFEDSFSDDSGGWDIYDDNKVVPPEYVISITPNWLSVLVLNQTFNATEGDYCMQFKMPKAVAANNRVGVGLIALATDNDNAYLFQVYNDGTCGLYKRVKKNWSTVWSSKSCGLKLDPDALNSLRLTVKDGKITALANGAQVKAVRAQIPTDPLKFGFYSQLDEEIDKNVLVKFTRFRVTTGQ